MHNTDKFDICVIGGAGHIGLPLSIAFASEGKKVIIYDINKKNFPKIKSGIMPFMEEGAEDRLKKVINKTLFLSDKPDVISISEFIIVIIGTPVDEYLNPTYSVIKKFFYDIINYLRNDHLIILRSTIFPGTTEKIQYMLKQHYPDIHITFCPERIAEGKAMKELYDLPQIISGFCDDAIEKTADLFRLLTEDIIFTSPMEAELTKLFANSWRYIQFATSNQFYMIAQEHGADFYKIYHALTYKYPRAQTFPRPGYTAGPCLLKDTMQLSAFASNSFFLGHNAMLINEGLPNFVLNQRKKEYNLRKMTIGILGMAFKEEIDDIRDSLSFKLKKLFELEAKEVYCSDLYVKNPSFISEEDLIQKCDIILIGAPHKKYKYLDYRNKILVDLWHHVQNS